METTCLMSPTLTLLAILAIDSRSASQRLWNSTLLRSCAAAPWKERRRAGGMYTPPERDDVNLANSSIASKSLSFSFASPFLLSAFPGPTAAMRAASWCLRSVLRAGRFPPPLDRPPIYAVEGGQSVTGAASREDHCDQTESETWNLSVKSSQNAKRKESAHFRPLWWCDSWRSVRHYSTCGIRRDE